MGYTTNTTVSSNKTHRTAVFLRVDPTVNSKDAIERRAKFVEAFNRPPAAADGGTIKVDFFTVQGDTVTIGVQDVIVTELPPVLSDSVKAAVAEAGFTLTGTPKPAVVAPSGRIGSPSLRDAARNAGYVQVAILDSL